MVVQLEITDRSGFREATVEQASFWLGSGSSGDVPLDVAGCHGRILEVSAEAGLLSIRVEPGLPFPVRCVTGNVGTRFQSMLDGDVLNVGPAMVKVRYVADDQSDSAEELDLATVRSPGAPVGSWYETFMEVADHLEGLTDPEGMVTTAMEAVLSATGADRVHLKLDQAIGKKDRSSFFLSGEGDETPFRVSSTLVERVRKGNRVVHVPIASADPVASQFVSIRKEGISSTIALPLSALGRELGVLYADCVRDGAVLTADELQRVVFIGRLLASALGNRKLVATLVRAEPSRDAAVHPALQTASPACEETVQRVKLYAPTDYTVLLRGETGVGKEVIAHALHDLSPRKSGPFVPVNCAAIPEQLMESVLFGHEKGAFTGAMQASRGHFEEAHGGTILLDEIGDMALDLQAKILRVLQDRVVMPVGSRRQVKVDLRIIAATHQDLEKMVEEHRFREDLYYRLRELEIWIPPLRDRREDLLMLCDRFLSEAARDLGLDAVPELAAATLDHLQNRQWRGNIREMRHLIKGAALRAAGGPIEVEHLDAGQPRAPGMSLEVSTGSSDDRTWKDRLEAQEKAALQDTFEKASGNLTKAAQLFGVPRTTYREKLVKNGLLKG